MVLYTRLLLHMIVTYAMCGSVLACESTGPHLMPNMPWSPGVVSVGRCPPQDTSRDTSSAFQSICYCLAPNVVWLVPHVCCGLSLNMQSTTRLLSAM